MDATASTAPSAIRLLPVQRRDAHGRAHVDYRAVIALAGPFMVNSAIQSVLNLTDTWFIGQISSEAMAAVGTVYWLVLVFVLLLGGVATAVQTVVAQAHGARRYTRAAQAAWSGHWGSLLTVPLFAGVALLGPVLLHPFGLQPNVERLALEFWEPRMFGAPLGVALWGALGFFNGIARPGLTLTITAIVAVLNAFLNQLFIFDLGMGIAGSAWATNVAQGLGCALAIGIFMSGRLNKQYRARLTWRPKWRPLVLQLVLGFPMGLLYAADILGVAIFQIMTVRLGIVDGAATQIVFMLTSIAYLPAFGISMTGTTLVGQSIGAGDKEWARRVGNATIALAVGYMAVTGILIAIMGPWLMALFTNPADPHALEVITLGGTLIWIAAGYQLFDGLNLGSGLALRGAGDATVPAVMVIVLSWFFFVPAAHSLSFAPGEGFVHFLPQFGYGVIGGWIASLLYVAALGTMLWLRWRSQAWKKIELQM